MRVSDSKLQSETVKAVLMIIFGIVNVIIDAAMFFAALAMTIEEGFDYFFIVVLFGGFLALFLWMLIAGVRKSHLTSTCRSYANIIAGMYPITTEQLGAVVHTPAEKVTKQLNEMLRRHYAEGFYVDRASGNIVCIGRPTVVSANRPHAQQSDRARVSVKCPACGGVTALPRRSAGVCDYCGSPIKSE